MALSILLVLLLLLPGCSSKSLCHIREGKSTIDIEEASDMKDLWVVVSDGHSSDAIPIGMTAIKLERLLEVCPKLKERLYSH